MEEGGSTSGKIRRTSSLCYTHIFNELIELESHVHDPKKAIQGGLYPPTQNPADQIAEPETATMLESYLRLLAHLCRESQPARHWLLHVSEFNLVGICFGLCADSVESHLRASAFGAVSALLVDKDVQRASIIWNNLDEWTVSGFHVGSKQPHTIGSFPRDDLWDVLANGYDESLAFMRLLQSLVEPYPDNQGLNDSLPFPETLGSTRRMPGIEKYVDFAMQRVFAERTPDVQQPLQRNVLTWACLRFIVTCLSTFNENLVIFANKSSIPVDAVIDTSSLEIYILLHPFTRVMEWLFNDKVLKALFASSHHDVKEVDAAPSDSPLVQSLMLSIEVMDLVMNLQATYIDIVRPVVKQQSSFHRSPVSNLSLASFEDAVINNLQLIVDLGLYCGTGHEMLTHASLQLLQKLASSRKLAITPGGFGQRSSRSKIVGVLEKDNEAERISRSLSNLLQYSEDELEAGVEAPGYGVKMRILDFLNGCIGASPGKPTIAHILLGFTCDSTTVSIAEDSIWNEKRSLFHAILVLGVKYPDIDGETFSSWRSEIKSRCWDIMQKLWRSSLTSSFVMNELRDEELIFVEAPTLLVVNMDTPWDGLSLAEGLEQSAGAEFICGTPAAALQNFLQYRAAFLDYEARALRLAVKSGLSTMKSRIQSVLLGTTILPGEDGVPNPNIFELFDFIEFTFPERIVPSDHIMLQGMDLKMCQEEKDEVTLYSVPLIEQLLLLKIKAFKKDRASQIASQDAAQNEQDELQMVEQARDVGLLVTDYNRRARLMRYHRDNLRSWVQLLTVTLRGCDFEPNARTSFVLQTLQVILPKLEAAYNGDLFMALQLASLAEALIQKIEFESTAFEKSKTGDFANDRLSQLFRAALIGIYSPISTVELREYCYQICIRYIHGTFDKSTKGSLLGRHTLNTVKNCGTHLLELVCDDAYSGQGTCKVSSLLLLTALVAIATRQESKYILETFVSLNFIGVLVDNIKHIPDELKAAGAPQVPMLLQYYDATLALLLRICQTRLGAAYVLNAGLFASIKQSGIFGVDPDIGIGASEPLTVSLIRYSLTYSHRIRQPRRPHQILRPHARRPPRHQRRGHRPGPAK
jgi:nuclear pore complex protein Nup205